MRGLSTLCVDWGSYQKKPKHQKGELFSSHSPLQGVQGGPGAQWAPPRTDRGGSRDRSPLKNFILEKDFPLPYPKGTDYISPVLREGAGGGPLPSRQGRDTVSPAGSGPAPQWGASRTDGRGNGDRRWTVATGDHRPQRGRQARRWPGRAGPEGVLAERSRRGDKIPAGGGPEEFSCPARSRAC